MKVEAMKCEAVQNRLLAAPDANDPGEELRVHVAGCAACRAVQARALQLDLLLADLPAAPSSEARKLAFLESVQHAGPIIRVKPSGLRTASGTFKPFRVVRWQHTAATAAALLVAIAGIWFFTRGKAPVPEVAEKPRHELLKKEVKHVTQLAACDSAPQRMTIWAEWASDLKAETKDLYKVAPSDELQSLARLFERAVQDGIVKQAKLLDRHMPAAERQALFRDALARLTDAETETKQLAQNAPPAAQKTLLKMSETARLARTTLEPLVKGV
jgi:hypothetical protein